MSLSDDDVEFAARFPALATRMAGLVNKLADCRIRANAAVLRVCETEAKLSEARRLLFEAKSVMSRWGNLCHGAYESLDARIDAWTNNQSGETK